MELNVKQSGIEKRLMIIGYRKAKSGKVTKRVRELYLRNDIACGLYHCTKCANSSTSNGWFLSEMLTNPTAQETNPQHSSVTSPHVVLLDAGAILKFIDVLGELPLTHVIIAQSVWARVKSANPATYKRMLELYTDNRDRFFVYLNEFSCHTFVDREAEGAPETYQRKALWKMADYLGHHWAEMGIAPYIVCEDEEARQKLADGFDGSGAMTLLDYVKGMPNCPAALVERISDLSQKGWRERPIFPNYWTSDALIDGLAKGTLKKGRFQPSMVNYREGWVMFSETERWFVKGATNMNRAMMGDQVVAQLLPAGEWEAPENAIRLRDQDEVREGAPLAEGGEEEEEAEGEGEKEDGGATTAKRRRRDTGQQQSVTPSLLPCARIVGVLERNWREYCGILLPSSNVRGGRNFLFAPIERNIPRIRVETSHASELLGKKIVVTIDNWPADSRYPNGHYVRVIGPEGDKETEQEVILLEHGINYSTKFAQSVLDCLPRMPWQPEPSPTRVDLTHLDICSVDPEGCTDIDDALHCRELGNGRFEVGVHIADVTNFVRPSTAIDIEAANRGTTVYLCGQRIDMLPELLSSNLCSLRGGELRYAFSVIWTLREEDASIETVHFTKSLIKSRAAFTYLQAQTRINDSEMNDPVTCSLRHLLKLSRLLKAKRRLLGALELASTEIGFEMDGVTGEPLKVREKQHLETNSLIEEFMLLANVSVAEKILNTYPDCAILRRHPVPTRENFAPLLNVAEECGFQLNVDTGKELAKSLEGIESQVRGRDDAATASTTTAPSPRGATTAHTKQEITMGSRMFRMLATRCMTTAVYFPAGTLAPAQYYHYGLAAPIYTHFTSPIRRYADIMVHRLLGSAIEADAVHPTMMDKKLLNRVTGNLNWRNRNAKYAARASILLNTFLTIKAHPEPELDAIVIGIHSNGIQVMVPKYGLESVIFLAERNKQAATTTTNTLEAMMEFLRLHNVRMFQQVTVSLNVLEKNQRRIIDVRLVKPHIEGHSLVVDCEMGIPT